MTRYELINLIEETVYETYDYDPDYGWSIDGEEVLKRIERLGVDFTGVINESN